MKNGNLLLLLLIVCVNSNVHEDIYAVRRAKYLHELTKKREGFAICQNVRYQENSKNKRRRRKQK
jgi:hypothetical protein